MDPSKSGSRMDNNDYNYKGQNRMFLNYADPSFNDPNAGGADASYLNQTMGYGNPMNFAEGIGGMAGMTGMTGMAGMAGMAGMPGMPGLGGSGLENMIPPNDQNMNYYQEYCRLFIANVVLTTQMKELIAEKNELLTRLTELERGEKITREPSTTDFGTDKKSRLRRKATEIERHYRCPVEVCQKNYGSEGSLIQHVKLKHPDMTEDPDWKMKLLHKSEASEGDKEQ